MRESPKAEATFLKLFLLKVIFILTVYFFVQLSWAEACKTLDRSSCSVLKDFVVADQNKDLEFKHLCSELDHNDGFSRSAYAFFEKSGKYKALVLAEVEAGWVSSPDPHTDLIGFSLILEKMRLEQLSEWAGQPFSIALELKNKKTKQVITGPPSDTYFYSHQNIDPVDKKYSISKKGHLYWEKLIEPEEEQKDRQTEAGTCVGCDKGLVEAPKRNEYKGSEFIQIDKNRIKNLEDPHTLYLVFRNETTGEKIKLKGPDIKNLVKLFNTKFSRPRVLTWEFLNPLQEGGLWDLIADTVKYRDCIYLRKQAKKDFNERFASF